MIRGAPLALLLLAVSSPATARLVVGYYPTWVAWSFPPSKVDFSHYTHLCHSFLMNDAEGNVSSEGNQVPSLELTGLAHKAGVRVLISLGGEGSGKTLNRGPGGTSRPTARP